MTQVMLRASAWRPERMLSAGTVLDSARLRRILGDHVHVDPKSIVAWMLGDHGATGFIPWSLCNVCGLELDAFCALNGLAPVDKAAVHQQTLDAGFRISERKGNTNHGIAASVFRIIDAIVGNEHSVLPVGVLLRGEYGVKDLVMSVPCVIGREGVEKVLNYPFAPGELGEFHRSEQHLRGLLAQA
jgi:L-lactate dehydrogenase